LTGHLAEHAGAVAARLAGILPASQDPRLQWARSHMSPDPEHGRQWRAGYPFCTANRGEGEAAKGQLL